MAQSMTNNMNILARVRASVAVMGGYIPGEQPTGRHFVKLNTNENPYEPPPEVLAAIHLEVGTSLRLYPEPTSLPVRQAAAAAYGLNPDQVVVGNGSDDLLTLVMRTFVEPGDVVAAADPTYTLYESLSKLQGGIYRTVPWIGNWATGEDWHLPCALLAATGAKVILVTRPNAPTGHTIPLAEVAELCRLAPGAVVLDEAYADFAEDHGLSLLADHPNLIVTRSFSKSLSLAGARIGLGFMSPLLAEQMHKVRDSYNVDRLAQAAATAALSHLDAFQPAIAAIKTERQRLATALQQRGFQVFPSQANFLLARIPPGPRDGRQWTADLKQVGILVRHFDHDPRLADKLRITIGTTDQMNQLLDAVDGLLRDLS